MREALKSALSLSWATSLLAAEQLTRLVTSGGRGRMHTNDRAPAAVTPPRPGRLNTRCVVALGSGLSAGAGDFSFSEESQACSFAAQAARQIGADFVLPLLQLPGIYGAPGLPEQPVVVPHLLQTTVVPEFPLRRPYNNLAVPGFELSDCLRRRPGAPLVHRTDARQTATNLVLGLPALTTEPCAPRPTQLEYALTLRPSLALVEFGYAEMLRVALSSDAARIGTVDEWAADLDTVVRSLREGGAAVVIATVPDPADTPACMALDAAARALRADVTALQHRYGLERDDHLTIQGLTCAAFHLLGGAGHLLEPAGVVRANVVASVSARVCAMNSAIEHIAREREAQLLDLCGLWRRVRQPGVRAGNRRLTADFLGGFYSLNGAFPGAAGHAVIANELLACLNEEFGAAFALLDVGAVAAGDPVADYHAPADGNRQVPPPRTPAVSMASLPSSSRGASATARLRLPPTLEMTVALSRAGSYHGDAIRVVNCRDEADVRYGSGAGVLFGGPALFDSHLTGALRIRFNPPRDDSARFEMSFDPLVGDEGVLSAPMFFRWPVRGCRVICEQNEVSGGTLNLATGEVSDLRVSVRFLNTALEALVGVNPGFPDQPIVFPGQYGSAWAKFEQRDDDALDFTFSGSTFLPLGGELGGEMVRWALPFANAASEFASVPARGLALHPHLHLSTRDPSEAHRPDGGAAPLELPHNRVCELTLFTRRSSCGDRFMLNTPELGGPAVGRSHLLGRLLVQTGEPSGGSMPVALSLLTPGGLLGQQPPSAIASLFPGRLSPGPIGHDEHLRFPIRNYFLEAVTLVDDPFDFSVGAIDLRSGCFINRVLHRGFIGQDLFFSLIRIEPRTPRESFLFRGPAAVEQAEQGDLVFRQRATAELPYPAGFAFPAPDLTSAIIVGEDSVLDPFLWLRATTDRVGVDAVTVRRRDVRSSTGEEFSFVLASDRAGQQPLRFEYTNHAQQGTFTLETVSWFGHARMATGGGDTDVYTFSGFGRWSKDPTERAHQAAAQIAIGAEEYVSIQIDAGLVSNVNTRPTAEEAALP